MNKEQKKQRIEEFISQNSEFIVDFITHSYDDVIAMYHISYRFCKSIEQEYALIRDKGAINEKRAEKYRKSLANGGLERRRQTMLQRYGSLSVKHSSAAPRKGGSHYQGLIAYYAEHTQLSLNDRWYNEQQNHTITAKDLLLYGANRLIKADKPIFNIGKTPQEFILNGGRREFAEECKLHKSEPLWMPTSIDLIEHYGYKRL